MGKKVTIKYSCDICRRESSRSDFGGGNNFGKGVLKLKGHRGCVSYNGDVGGHNFDKSFDLCYDCCDKILELIRGKCNGKQV